MPEKKLNMAEMKNHMSGAPAPLYFFYGEDEHTKGYYEKALKDKVLAGDTMNYYKFDDSLSFDELEDCISSYPMFGGNKFVLVKNSKLFKNPGTAQEEKSDKLQRFVSLVSDVPEFVTLVFSENEVDKTNNYFKALSQYAISFEAAVQTPDVLEQFVSRYALSKKVVFDRDAAKLLVEGIGTDTMVLINETDKLCLAAGENGKINNALVRECCALNIQTNIFMLTDALVKSDKTEAMAFAESMLNSGENVQKLLIMIGQHFSKLFYVKEMAHKGMSKEDIADELGNKPYYITKLLNQAAGLSPEKLKANVDFCFKTDCDIKAGLISDTDALDLLIMTT